MRPQVDLVQQQQVPSLVPHVFPIHEKLHPRHRRDGDDQGLLSGSRDGAFVRAILQKGSMTSKQLLREADIYISVDERARDLIE